MANRLLDSYKVGFEHDRRRKLTREHIDLIHRMYKAGMCIREIARRFEHICSRRAIQFTLFPDRLKARPKQDWAKYYDKEKHRKYTAKHRAYKKVLINMEG